MKFVLALGVPIGVVGVALAVVVGDMGMTGNAMRLARVNPDQVGQSSTPDERISPSRS